MAALQDGQRFGATRARAAYHSHSLRARGQTAPQVGQSTASAGPGQGSPAGRLWASADPLGMISTGHLYAAGGRLDPGRAHTPTPCKPAATAIGLGGRSTSATGQLQGAPNLERAATQQGPPVRAEQRAEAGTHRPLIGDRLLEHPADPLDGRCDPGSLAADAGRGDVERAGQLGGDVLLRLRQAASVASERQRGGARLSPAASACPAVARPVAMPAAAFRASLVESRHLGASLGEPLLGLPVFALALREWWVRLAQGSQGLGGTVHTSDSGSFGPPSFVFGGDLHLSLRPPIGAGAFETFTALRPRSREAPRLRERVRLGLVPFLDVDDGVDEGVQAPLCCHPRPGRTEP